MKPTFSVIVPTCGRESLTQTLASLAPQIGDGDELIVLRRDDAPWGHAARDEAMPRCNGTHLWFMDDDDIAAPGALTTIREKVGVDPDTIHIFRMQNSGGGVYWSDPVARYGNVGTPMMVVPNVPGKLGVWNDNGVYEGDWKFLSSTLKLRGDTPVFHREIVALIA